MQSLSTAAEFLYENPEKSLKSFPPCYSQSVTSTALLEIYSIFIQTHATSYSFCTAERRKT
jgi:hypothetical protein